MPQILVAPDSFKGTFSSSAVAAAIGEGIERVPGFVADLLPVADGGEGTAQTLQLAAGGEHLPVQVTGPLGKPTAAEFVLLPDGKTAVLDMAAASGLDLIIQSERDPLRATTYGTGELIIAAVAAGAKQILIGAGGSATVDGGAGAVEAIEAGGGLQGAKLTVLCDVRTPFEDAAALFGPQKGANAKAVKTLQERLIKFADSLPRDPRGVPLTGAAGGLSGGLWAQHGAKLTPGAPYVLDQVGFDQRMRNATAVVTGEGRLDSGTLAGKLGAEIATRSRQGGVPCHAVVGENQLDVFGERMLDLESVQQAPTLRDLRSAGKRLATSISRATKT